MTRRRIGWAAVLAMLTAALTLSPTPEQPVASAATVFNDDFASGAFTAWNAVTNMTIDPRSGGDAPPSARAQPSSAPSFAYKLLPTVQGDVCMSLKVNVSTQGPTTLVLIRLRTAANGPIIRVFVSATGILSLRSDVSATQRSSGVALGTGWHSVELCGTVGTASDWDLFRDGSKIIDAWVANTGTTPVGRVEIGDTAAKTFTANFDDVMVADEPIPDTAPPSTPGKPTGSSPAPGVITLAWAASQDASPPITYRVYRDGQVTPIETTTSTTYEDAELTPGSSHVYAVDAVDASNNASPKGPPSDPIIVSGGAFTLFSDDFTGGSLSAWSGTTRLSVDPTRGGVAPPSARAQVSNQSAFAYEVLGTQVASVCMRTSVNVSTQGPTTLVLIRLRTAANGPIIRVFVSATGILSLRSDVSATQRSSGVALGTGWHSVELCGTVGTASDWDLFRDGSKIIDAWVANTGTTPVGRVEIGDTAAKTFTANFDDVMVTNDQGPTTARPNILIFLTDDQRASDTVIPGVMPKLRQWLLAGGRQYPNFFDSTPLCCPDRSVILSGRYAHNTGVRTNPDGANLDHAMTMERVLQQAGYRTAFVGKFLNDWPTSAAPPYFTNRALVGGGYANVWFNVDGVGRLAAYSTDFIGQQTVTYLDAFEQNDEQPWMLIASTPAPHYPWQPAPEYATADVGTWSGNPATGETDRSDKPPWVQARNKSLADGEAVRTPQLRTLMSVDDMVDTVMTRVQQLGELSDTLVIYLSDNGYVWAEHRLGGDYGTGGQKRYPYTESVKVPFLLRWDGHVQPGSADTRLASTVDVVPTVLQAAGISADYAVDGHSLLSSVTRSRLLLEYWLDPGDASIPTWVSLRTATVQFVEYYDVSGNVSFREYYDLASDPWQLVNLLNDGNPTNPNVSQLVAQVRSDATCIGTAETIPPATHPCP